MRGSFIWTLYGGRGCRKRGRKRRRGAWSGASVHENVQGRVSRKVVSDEGGLSQGRSFVRVASDQVVSHRGGLSAEWSLIGVVSDLDGLLTMWSLIRVVFVRVVSLIREVLCQSGLSHQGGLLSEWSLSSGRSFVRVVSQQGGLLSGWSLSSFYSLSLIRMVFQRSHFKSAGIVPFPVASQGIAFQDND